MAIFCEGLDRETSQSEVVEFFDDYMYDFKKFYFSVDPQTGIEEMVVCRGSAYIEFLSDLTEIKAVESLSDKELKGRRIRLTHIKAGYKPKDRPSFGSNRPSRGTRY